MGVGTREDGYWGIGKGVRWVKRCYRLGGAMFKVLSLMGRSEGAVDSH